MLYWGFLLGSLFQSGEISQEVLPLPAPPSQLFLKGRVLG